MSMKQATPRTFTIWGVPTLIVEGRDDQGPIRMTLASYSFGKGCPDASRQLENGNWTAWERMSLRGNFVPT